MTNDLWIGVVGAGLAPIVRASAVMRQVAMVPGCVTIYRIGRGGGLVLPALPVDEIGAVPLHAFKGRSTDLDDVVAHLFESWEYTGSSPATTTATIFASADEKALVSAVLRRLGITRVEARAQARDLVEAALRSVVATYVPPSAEAR